MHRRDSHRSARGGDVMSHFRRHWARRRLRLVDDVEILEAYQRDLEQEAADVAERIRRLAAEPNQEGQTRTS